MSRPWPIRRLSHQSGTHRVEMDVPQQDLEVGVLLTQVGPVSSFKQMSSPAVPQIELLRIACQNPLHDARQGDLTHLYQKMEVLACVQAT